LNAHFSSQDRANGGSINEITKRLRAEGYGSDQVFCAALSKQFQVLIKTARDYSRG
jgi:hypothetical protein